MHVRAYDANILCGGRQGDFPQSFLVHVSPCDGLFVVKKIDILQWRHVFHFSLFYSKFIIFGGFCRQNAHLTAAEVWCEMLKWC